jgi:hypothetical protein
MTVEITATISINKDGTWHILNFGKEQKVIDEEQVLITGYGNDGKPDIQGYVDSEPDTEWDRKRDKLIRKGEIDKDAYPTSWHLNNAKELREQVKRKPYNRGPNHCGICGMKNKNKLTCLSIIDINGKLVNGEQRHRAPVSYTRGWE